MVVNAAISSDVADDLKRFGERVRARRKAVGWSQEQLAHECNLDRSYIGGVERGERNVSLLNICKIAGSLAVPPADLFAAEDE